MENASNALIMAGSILLFIIALSFGVYTYSRILSINDKILTTSENYARTAENFTLNYVDSEINGSIERNISGAEVSNQILEMVRGSNDYHYESIRVSSNLYNTSYFSGIESGGVFGKTIVEDEHLNKLTTSLYNLSNKNYKVDGEPSFTDSGIDGAGDNVSIRYKIN